MTLTRWTRIGTLAGLLAIPLSACSAAAGPDAEPEAEPVAAHAEDAPAAVGHDELEKEMAQIKGRAPRDAPAATHQEAVVKWHPQQEPLGNAGEVQGARANLTRHDGGAAFQFHARDLTPGHAYTLWVITINNPDACAEEVCTGPELFPDEDPKVDSDAQVFYGAGHVAGDGGRATFAGHIKEGPLDGWLPDRSLDDASSAQVLFTLNDHGPVLEDYMPGMIRTYRGGCTTESIPGIFPETAHADGEPGPNECRLSQSAAFPTP